jgi:hypothetical protein
MAVNSSSDESLKIFHFKKHEEDRGDVSQYIKQQDTAFFLGAI